MTAMRSDGSACFFFVQHRNSHDEWVPSSLDHFLFNGMRFEEKRSELADRYRQIIRKQSASQDLWQKYGVYGFTEREDVAEALTALRERHPDQEFRAVRRVIDQKTYPQAL
jgi:hypothetical protein